MPLPKRQEVTVRHTKSNGEQLDEIVCNTFVFASNYPNVNCNNCNFTEVIGNCPNFDLIDIALPIYLNDHSIDRIYTTIYHIYCSNDHIYFSIDHIFYSIDNFLIVSSIDIYC